MKELITHPEIKKKAKDIAKIHPKNS